MDKTQLEAGLAALTAAAEAGNGAVRQKELFAKAQAGTITTEENDELVKSLGGHTLAKSVTAPFATNDVIAKSIDVSDYLRETNNALQKSLEVLADHVQKSEANDQSFRVALATSLNELGKVVKSVQDDVARFMASPRGPVQSTGVNTAGATAPAVVDKPIAGQSASGKLSKSEALAIMQEISDRNGGKSSAGEDMSVAITNYEQFNQLTKSLADECLAIHKSRRAQNQQAAAA